MIFLRPKAYIAVNTVKKLTCNYSVSKILCCNVQKDDSKNQSQLKIATSSSSTSVGNAVPLGQKVKETTTTIWYSAVVLAGIGVTAGVLFYVFRELFSGQSPQAIYSKAFEHCVANGRVCDLLGEPIKGHGEENSRGRRRHISYMEFMQNGVQHLRMSFYIVGTRRKGKVHLEMHKDENDKYVYDYLIVETQGYPRETVIVEDNRNS